MTELRRALKKITTESGDTIQYSNPTHNIDTIIDDLESEWNKEFISNGSPTDWCPNEQLYHAIEKLKHSVGRGSGDIV